MLKRRGSETASRTHQRLSVSWAGEGDAHVGDKNFKDACAWRLGRQAGRISQASGLLRSSFGCAVSLGAERPFLPRPGMLSPRKPRVSYPALAPFPLVWGRNRRRGPHVSCWLCYGLPPNGLLLGSRGLHPASVHQGPDVLMVQFWILLWAHGGRELHARIHFTQAMGTEGLASLWLE